LHGHFEYLPRTDRVRQLTRGADPEPADFGRLERRPFDGARVIEFVEDIARENFLDIAGLIEHSADRVPEAILREIRNIAAQTQDQTTEYSLQDFLHNLRRKSFRVSGIPAPISVLDFLCDAEKSDALFYEQANGEGHAPRVQKALFCQHLAQIDDKLKYWAKYGGKLTLSPVPDIFSGAFLTRLNQGDQLTKAIQERITESPNIPEGVRIDCQIALDFAYTRADTHHPEICFQADPKEWALYGKELMAIAEDAVQAAWGELYDLADTMPPANSAERQRALETLDSKLGLSSYLEELCARGIPFERSPSALNYASGRFGNHDTRTTTANYLEFFCASFSSAAKKKGKGLHRPDLCPRWTSLHLESGPDGQETMRTTIRPALVFDPLMSPAEADALIGPPQLLKAANSRINLVGHGDAQVMTQVMGGETLADEIYWRDKRAELRAHPRRDESHLIAAANAAVRAALEASNLGNMQPLYRVHYMMEYLARHDLPWNQIAQMPALITDDLSLEQIKLELFEWNGATVQPARDESKNARVEAVAKIIRGAQQHARQEMQKARQRSDTLRHQIESGAMHYRTATKAVEACTQKKDFVQILASAGVPADDLLQDYILHIYAFRLIERKDAVQDAEGRAQLLRDNLDTVAFFRLAEEIVVTALQPVFAGKGMERFTNANVLLIQQVARMIYKFVVGGARVEEFRQAAENPATHARLFVDLNHSIAESLARKGYRTKLHHTLAGESPNDGGYVEMIAECQLPEEEIRVALSHSDGACAALQSVIGDLAEQLEVYPDNHVA